MTAALDAGRAASPDRYRTDFMDLHDELCRLVNATLVTSMAVRGLPRDSERKALDWLTDAAYELARNAERRLSDIREGRIGGAS